MSRIINPDGEKQGWFFQAESSHEISQHLGVQIYLSLSNQDGVHLRTPGEAYREYKGSRSPID